MSITFNLYRNFDGTLDGRYKQGNKPSASPASADLVVDSFESGNMTPSTNNASFSWEGNNLTSIVTMDNGTPTAIWNNGAISNPDVTVPTKNWSAYEGNNSLRFRYPASGNMAEQRFNFNAQSELWVRYWIRVPTNFSHGSLNNKFFSIWGDAYDANGTITWQTRPDGGSGSARLVVQDGGVISGESLSTPFIDVATDLGRWMQVVLYMKLETSSEAGDGILRFYRRWDGESSFTLLQENTACVNQWGDGSGYRSGYLMGWANDPYISETEWLVDSFETSTGSLI